jgi:hypothetical protein
MLDDTSDTTPPYETKTHPNRQGPRYVTDKGHPLVRHLFTLLNERRVDRLSYCKRVGVHPKTMDNWRNMYNPNLLGLEAAFTVLGYKLIAVPAASTDTDAMRRDFEQRMAELENTIAQQRRQIASMQLTVSEARRHIDAARTRAKSYCDMNYGLRQRIAELKKKLSGTGTLPTE